MTRVVRLVPEVDAAGVVLRVTTGALASGLGDSSAPIGDGDAVDGARGESDGAGMTVTTADGDGRRDRLGEGAGLTGLALGLGALERLGDGNGGMTLVGELEGWARWLLDGDGLGVLLARGGGDAFGVDVGDGGGAAVAADPSSTAGASATAARPSSSGRRAFGTREL